MEVRVNQTDVVLLLPGFLGFGQLGELPYFDPRVLAILRTTLHQGLPERRLAVHVCETLPTSSLEARQAALKATLEAAAALYVKPRFHLVGHSTGGVDARLMAALPASSSAIEAVRSVVCLCTPHHGTHLADDPIARVLAGAKLRLRPRDWMTLIDLIQAIPSLVNDIRVSLLAAMSDWRRVMHFIKEVMRTRVLIHQLTPAHMAKIHLPLRKGVELRSVVVVAPEQEKDESDPVFELLDRRI